MPGGEWNSYKKWLRFYLDFCCKYKHGYTDAASLAPFLEKLASRRQGDAAREQAGKAVAIYLRMVGEGKEDWGKEEAGGGIAEGISGSTGINPVEAGAGTGRDACATGVSWVREFKELRNSLKLKHYSPKTLKTYTHWTRRFQAFVRSKDPQTLTVEDVKAFLTDLAVSQGVSASTQNQAFNSLLYFFRNALSREFGRVDGVVRAKYRRYIPVVLSREEIEAVINRLESPFDLAVKLMFGCGLRISECLNLRVGCFNCDARVLTVHDGKGQKDRTVPLPELVLDEVKARFLLLNELLEAALPRSAGRCPEPDYILVLVHICPMGWLWNNPLGAVQ